MDSQCTGPPVIGQSKTEDGLGLITGFAPAGRINGPRVQLVSVWLKSEVQLVIAKMKMHRMETNLSKTLAVGGIVIQMYWI